MTIPITITLTVTLDEVDIEELRDSDGDITDGLIEAVGYELSETAYPDYKILKLVIGENNLSLTPYHVCEECDKPEGGIIPRHNNERTVWLCSYCDRITPTK